MRLRATILSLTLAATATVAPATAAIAEQTATTPTFRKYVALGDSYSAGPFIPWLQASWCIRSNNNYPSWLATKLGLYYTSGAFVDATCSGAETKSMTHSQSVPEGVGLATNPPQFDNLTLDTDLVTVGIGGNDYSVFSSLMFTCAEKRDINPTGSPCKDHFTVNGVNTMGAAVADIERNVTDVIQGVRDRSPGAKIVVVGYPRIVPPTGTCPDVLPFATGDYPWIDSVERALNKAIATAAKRKTATFVDTYGPSLGHDACAGDEAWVNGQHHNFASALAYHPFKAGMMAEADLIFKALGGGAAFLGVPGPRHTATAGQRDLMAALSR